MWSSGNEASDDFGSCVNTTTSHWPFDGAVGTISFGTSCDSSPAISDGNRLSNTATSHSPFGTSVGFAGSTVTASGLYSGGGRKVRPWRNAAYVTHSPRNGCQR